MTPPARWLRLAVEVLLPPLGAWLVVLSAAPQFREYAVEGVLLWFAVTVVRQVQRNVGAVIAWQRNVPSAFDSFVRQPEIPAMPVAQRVDADRLAALASDPGVFDRDVLPLLRDVTDRPLDEALVARRDLSSLLQGIPAATSSDVRSLV